VPFRVLDRRRIHRRDGVDAQECKLRRSDLVAVGQQDHALHRVRELPHVTRPGVSGENAPRLGQQHARRQTVVGTRAGQEMLGQREDIRPAATQRWQVPRDDREPMVEILAKAALVHGSLEIDARRCHHRDIDRLLSRAPEPAHAAILQNPQKLSLQCSG
jgi:hypothetical protein